MNISNIKFCNIDAVAYFLDSKLSGINISIVPEPPNLLTLNVLSWIHCSSINF